MGLKQEIIRLRNLQYSYNKIAQTLNCAKSTVSYHCTSEGLDDQGTKLVALKPKLVSAIQNEIKNNTVIATAKKFGVSTSTVKKYRKLML